MLAVWKLVLIDIDTLNFLTFLIAALLWGMCLYVYHHECRCPEHCRKSHEKQRDDRTRSDRP